jgi:CheY-like chemotaxis protein
MFHSNPKEKYSVTFLDGLEVLFVEKEILNIKVLRMILEPFGVNISHAQNANEAVEIAANKQFDVILIDIQMYLASGIKAFKVIKSSDNLNKYTPLIAVTKNKTADESQNHLCLGIVGEIKMPFKNDVIIRTIARALNFKPSNDAYVN